MVVFLQPKSAVFLNKIHYTFTIAFTHTYTHTYTHTHVHAHTHTQANQF